MPDGARFWPTPKSCPSGPDYARATRPRSGGDDLATAVARLQKGPLCVEFVELLMGYPAGVDGSPILTKTTTFLPQKAHAAVQIMPPTPHRVAVSPRTRWPRDESPILVFAIVHVLVVACAVGLGYATMGPVAATTDQTSMAFPARMFVQLAVTIPVLAWALSRDHWLARRLAAVVAQGLFLLPTVAAFYILGIIACVLAPVAVPDAVAFWGSLALALGVTAGAYCWNRVIAHDAVMVVAITVFVLVVGVKIGVAPCMAFLAAMCVVDFIAVYFSRHMVTLAERSMERRLFPILIVPPTRAGLLDDARTAAADRAGGTAVLGLGDLGIPSMLVVSATFFAGPGPAVGALLGILAGYGLLAVMLRRGSWHAGLPPLAGGAVVGCLLGAVLTGVALW